jgi:hypothetical protein
MRRSWRLRLLLYMLLSIAFSTVSTMLVVRASQPSDQGWLEPFRIGIGVTSDLENPSRAGGGGRSTEWAVDVISLAPGESVLGRPIVDPSDTSLEALRQARFSRGDHLLFAVLGSVSISTTAGESGNVAGGDGVVMFGGDPQARQYRISNPTAVCATVIRLSVTGLGGMAGARAPQETPMLPGSCGESRVLFRETQYFSESDTLTATLLLLHSTGNELWEARPHLVAGQQLGIAVLQGDVVLELLGGCTTCSGIRAALYAPGSAVLEPGQEMYLTLAEAKQSDEVILLVAGLGPATGQLPFFDGNSS